MRTKQDVLMEFRRREILAAARAVFSRHGYWRSTMEDVAAEAGLAKGTLYLYFHNKEEIYFAALEEELRKIQARVQAQVARQTEPRARLQAWVETALACAEEHRDFFKIFFSEFNHLFFSPLSALEGRLRRLYMTGIKTVEQILEEGMRRGVFRRTEPRKTALLVIDLVRGLVEARLLGWSRSRLERDTEFLLRFVIRGIVEA